MKSTLVALLRTSRPYYVIQAIAPPIAGCVGASQNGVSFITIVTVACVFGLLAMAAWSSDEIIDRDLDSRGRPKTYRKLYVAGGTGTILALKLPVWLVTTYILVLTLTALGLAATVGITFLVLVVIAGAVGIFYSLPPVKLKIRGIFGAYITAASYGLVAFTAGCVAAGRPISYSTLAVGVIMSVLVLGYDGIGHIIDYADDKANGLNTFAVRLDLPIATKLLASCQVLPIVALWCLGFTGLLTLNMIGVALMLVVTTFTAIFMISVKSEQPLCAMRLISVPILSASFFLML